MGMGRVSEGPCPISPRLPTPHLVLPIHSQGSWSQTNTKAGLMQGVLYSWGRGLGWAGMQMQKVMDHMGRMGMGAVGGGPQSGTSTPYSGGTAEGVGRGWSCQTLLSWGVGRAGRGGASCKPACPHSSGPTSEPDSCRVLQVCAKSFLVMSDMCPAAVGSREAPGSTARHNSDKGLSAEVMGCGQPASAASCSGSSSPHLVNSPKGPRDSWG